MDPEHPTTPLAEAGSLHETASSNEGCVQKVRKTKKMKKSKNVRSNGRLLSPTSSFSENDHEHPPLTIDAMESWEGEDSPRKSTGQTKNHVSFSDIETDTILKNKTLHDGGPKPVLKTPQKADTEEKIKMFDMLQAITESYRGIQSRLDVVGDSMKTSAVFVQSNWRNVERLLIALLLIPAFVMSTIAVYRQSDNSYDFDLGEIQKEQMYYIALKNFDAWNEALISQDSSRISNLYATDLSFLPTMSDQFVVSTRSEDKYPSRPCRIFTLTRSHTFLAYCSLMSRIVTTSYDRIVSAQ